MRDSETELYIFKRKVSSPEEGTRDEDYGIAQYEDGKFIRTNYFETVQETIEGIEDFTHSSNPFYFSTISIEVDKLHPDMKSILLTYNEPNYSKYFREVFEKLEKEERKEIKYALLDGKYMAEAIKKMEEEHERRREQERKRKEDIKRKDMERKMRRKKRK